MSEAPITESERWQLTDLECEIPHRFQIEGARALPDAYKIIEAYEAALTTALSRNKELEEALEPFAGVAFEGLAADTDVVQYHVVTRGPGHATVGDFRRARSVLGGE